MLQIEDPMFYFSHNTLVLQWLQEPSTLTGSKSVSQTFGLANEFIPLLVIHKSTRQGHVTAMVPYGRGLILVILATFDPRFVFMLLH